MPESSAADADAETIVIGARLPPPLGEEAYATRILDRQALTESASGRLENILSGIAGFQQFRRTDSRAANPTTQSATLRPFGGNATSRALVLLDGVPQADPFAGFIPYSALRPERLVRVRATRGGGIGPYGAGSVGGTIELESGAQNELLRFSGQSAVGSGGATTVSAGANLPVGKGFVSLYGGWDRGRGYFIVPAHQRGPADRRSPYRQWSAAPRLVMPLGDGVEAQVAMLVYDDHRRRGLDSANIRSRGVDGQMRLLKTTGMEGEVSLYVQRRHFRSRFVSASADRKSTVVTLDQYDTPATGLGGKVELRPRIGTQMSLRIGGDIRHAQGHTHEYFRYQAGIPTRERVAGGREGTMGLFAEGSWRRAALTLTAGGRLDYWRITRGKLVEWAIDPAGRPGALTYSEYDPKRSGKRLSARGGAVLRLRRRLALRTAAYAGFRLPTLNELYRPFRVGLDATAANPALRVERLRGIEGGMDWQDPTLSIGVTGYYNRLAGAISNVTLGQGPGVYPQVGFVAAGGAYRQKLNVKAIHLWGIEVDSRIRWRQLMLSASYAFGSPRVHAEGAAAQLDGKRPAQAPRHQGVLGLTFDPAADRMDSATPKRGIARIRAMVPLVALTLRYVGAQWDDDLQTRRLPAALTFDAVLDWRLSRVVHLVLRGENLGNRRVVSGKSAAGIEDIGTPRTLWGGLRVEFGR